MYYLKSKTLINYNMQSMFNEGSIQNFQFESTQSSQGAKKKVQLADGTVKDIPVNLIDWKIKVKDSGGISLSSHIIKRVIQFSESSIQFIDAAGVLWELYFIHPSILQQNQVPTYDLRRPLQKFMQ